MILGKLLLFLIILCSGRNGVGLALLLYCSAVSHQGGSCPLRGRSSFPTVMYINLASGDSPDHGHPHGLQWYHRPQVSTWPLAVSGPLIQLQPSVAACTTSLNIVSVGYTCHSHQLPDAANPEDITKALGSNTNCICLHGSQALS